MGALRLRGHHLICLHFFRGEGYDAGFVDNLFRVVSKAGSGADIKVVEGPDDVCAACRHLNGDRCGYDEGAEDSVRQMDTEALRMLGLRPFEGANWQTAESALPGIMGRWSAVYCKGCDWLRACLKNPRYAELLSPPPQTPA